MKQARDSKTQALYALRGKIRNVEKVDLDTVFQNQEIKDIITLLGCGINEEFDINKLQYSKVIIASDEDSDGSHIGILLLTFFYRFMPELIKRGHIYKCMGPLFKIMYNNKHEYVRDNKERDKVLAKIKDKYKYTVVRYKGLVA